MKNLYRLMILGFTAGMLGNIPKTILYQYFCRTGQSKLKCSDMVAGVFLPAPAAKLRIKRKRDSVFSFVADFLVSGLNGISYLLFLHFTGKRHAVVKGWLMGLADFAVYRGIVVKLGRGKVYSRDPKTNLTMSINSTVWGISTALFARLLDRCFLQSSCCQSSRQSSPISFYQSSRLNSRLSSRRNSRQEKQLVLPVYSVPSEEDRQTEAETN